jgi:hypothetical protein
MPLKDLASKELLSLHAHISALLRKRGIVRSASSLTNDVAEILFCRAFGWTRARKNPSADAIAENGILYQIRGCRIYQTNAPRQIPLCRNLSDCKFDFLAVALLEVDYSVRQAALVSFAQVLEHSSFNNHRNSWVFTLHDHVWEWPEVQDVTTELRGVRL